MKAEHIRRVRFEPYQVGMGPTFILDLFDLHTFTRDGKNKVGYILTEATPECPHVIFRSSIGVPHHKSIDEDSVVKGVMNFATLRPGDTDRNYFDDYTDVQMHFATHHAEVLSLYASEGDWIEDDGESEWEGN